MWFEKCMFRYFFTFARFNTRSHERLSCWLCFALASLTWLFIFLWPGRFSYRLSALFLILGRFRPCNWLTLWVVGQVFIWLVIRSCHALSVTTCLISSRFYSSLHLKDAVNRISILSPCSRPANRLSMTREAATRRRLVFIVKQVFFVGCASRCILCMTAHTIELWAEILWVANRRLWQTLNSQFWRRVLLRY